LSHHGATDVLSRLQSRITSPFKEAGGFGLGAREKGPTRVEAAVASGHHRSCSRQSRRSASREVPPAPSTAVAEMQINHAGWPSRQEATWSANPGLATRQKEAPIRLLIAIGKNNAVALSRSLDPPKEPRMPAAGVANDRGQGRGQSRRSDSCARQASPCHRLRIACLPGETRDGARSH